MPFCVNLFDIYDVDTFRLTRDISVGDLALIMQNVAMITPYNIRVYYFCTVKFKKNIFCKKEDNYDEFF